MNFIVLASLVMAGPHEHGTASLSVAVESDRGGALVFESPSESLYGFEHEAKTPRDKAKQQEALDILKNQMTSMFKIDSRLECSVKNTALTVVSEDHDHHDHDHDHGEHREVHGRWNIDCQKSWIGAGVHLNFKKFFPKLAKIRVTILGEKSQKEVVLKNAEGDLKIQ